LAVQSLPYVGLLGLLFGSTLVVSRFSVGQFEPSTYIGLRLLLASLGHVAIYTLIGRRHWPTDPLLWRRAALLGVLGTAVPMTSIVTSLQYQSSGITSLLLTVNPALTVILAHFFLDDERLSQRKAIGIILALSGAGLLIIRGESGIPGIERANPIGYGLVLLAMLCASSMAIYARKHMRELDAFDVASVRMLVATLVVMPLSAIFIGINLDTVTREGYLALGYASLAGTFSGMMLAFYVIKRFGATSSAMTSYVIPIVAGAGGALFLGETITLFMVVGMVLIILGIAIINERNPVTR
jgi:drug/metabolite transporter (DMT)-like permease